MKFWDIGIIYGIRDQNFSEPDGIYEENSGCNAGYKKWAQGSK